ncbi:restriction endonuclease subunit S, partial [Acinetobacter baumannii]|uniref:restriction endonuclease subunit S n=1 Tax=Acinetobacter baumannii TaxID=470 RepID=UPI0029C57C95
VESGAKWLKIADVGIQEMTPNNPSYLPLGYLDKYSQFIVNKNDYVIALTRPILNKKLKIAQVGNLYDGALLNQRVAKIHSKNNNLDFIYSLLQRSKTVEELENSIAGTDPPNLSLNDVKEIKL